MDFTLTPEQTMLQQMARELARDGVRVGLPLVF